MNGKRLLLLAALKAHDLVSGRIFLGECPETSTADYADGDWAKWVWEGKMYFSQTELGVGLMFGLMGDCFVIESRIDPTNSNKAR